MNLAAASVRTVKRARRSAWRAFFDFASEFRASAGVSCARPRLRGSSLSVTGFLGPLLSAAMGSRGKRHSRALGFLAGSPRGFVSAGNLLALGGLGWAAYEIWRSKQRETQASSARAVVPGTIVEGGLPPPIPSAPAAALRNAPAPAIQADVQRIVDLTLAAARCDGALTEDEYARILTTARDIGAEAMVRNALDRPRPLAEIVAGVNDRKQREALYVYAFSVVRADEDVVPAERTWLQLLASHLGLEGGTTARLEKETALRIASMSAPA